MTFVENKLIFERMWESGAYSLVKILHQKQLARKQQVDGIGLPITCLLAMKKATTPNN